MSYQNENNDYKPTLVQRIMAKFSYSQKINTIFALVFGVALAVTSILVFRQLQTIAIIKMELVGMRYENKLRDIVELLSRERILNLHYNSGNKAIKSNIEALQNEITEAFSELIAIDKELGEKLETKRAKLEELENVNLLPRTLEGEWQAINNSLFNLSANQSDRQFQALIDQLNRLIIYVGDSSMLVFDPKIETYNLIEGVLYQFPASQSLIGKILYAADNIKDEEARENQLYELTSLLKENLSGTQLKFQKVFIKDNNTDKELGSKQQLNLPLTRYLAATEQFINAAQTLNNDSQEALVPLDTLRGYGLQASNTNFLLWKATSLEIDRLLNDRIYALRVRGIIMLTIVVTILSFACAAGILVLSETKKFISDIFDAISLFSEGDLSSRSLRVAHDTVFEKLRQVLNELGDRIETVITQLQRSCVELTTSTTQIAAAAKHQEGTVFQQEATVKQIVVTAEEISSTAKDFAITIENVSKVAEETSALATSGRQELSHMESSINQMVAASSTIASKLGTLNEKATAITSVITTITTVADRTNLLSLNAAIEAEKAGAQGKSFSVIAKEIRRLADQVANATLDIEKMINEMMASVSEGVMGVDRFNEEIRHGAAQVSEISERFTKIIEQVQHLSHSFERVNSGMKNQFLGAEQINESIVQLSDAAQQTTRSIRQFHSAIEQLTLLTKAMQGSVSSMKK